MQKQKEDKNNKKVKWINPLRDRTRIVPFVVPNEQQRLAALGSLVGQKWRLKKSLQTIVKDFLPIKKPQPGDNLFQNQQDGQDFTLFSSMYRNHIDPNEEIIYIATFYCNLSKPTLQYIKKKAKAFFHGVKVKMHHFQNTDLSKFDPMQSPNKQKYYDAAKMNQYFTKHLPKKTYSIAIITNLLIYNGNNPKQQLEQRWIFGLGSIKDRTSITSAEEIVKKGYGIVKQQNCQDQSEQNIVFFSKVINHQLCHTFGMKHCIFFTCTMNGSNGYEQAQRKVDYLCPICLRKLQLAIGFDIAQRYEVIGDEMSMSLAQKIRKVVK